MKIRNALIGLSLLLGLAACGGSDSGKDGNAPSIAEIEKQAGGNVEPAPAPVGVQPVVYSNEDAELAKKAPEGMVYIKGGCFTMGTNDAQVDEKFAHEVCLDGFYLDQYEVTQKRWKQVMGYNPAKHQGEDRPVEQVNYFDIQKFIKKSNGACRLPTEAEWEYAAGGSLVRTRYYWGNIMDGEYAWYEDNANGETHPVGQKKPNQYGLYDMMGNVWEWTEDWYVPRFDSFKLTNPKGPETGEYKVIRGGALDTSAGGLRITNRTWLHPKNRVYTKITTYGGIINEIFNYIGFRCARDIKVDSPSSELPSDTPPEASSKD